MSQRTENEEKFLQFLQDCHHLHFFFLSFFGGTGNWTQDLSFTLAKQAFYLLHHTTTTLILLRFTYFGDEVSYLCLDCDTPICASTHSFDDRHAPLHPAIG
jgi:hypothetical protein